MALEMDSEEIREAVREKYAAAARRVQEAKGTACCGVGSCGGGSGAGSAGAAGRAGEGRVEVGGRTESENVNVGRTDGTGAKGDRVQGAVVRDGRSESDNVRGDRTEGAGVRSERTEGTGANGGETAGSGAASCCAGSGGSPESSLYEAAMLREVPEGAALASLGCGNPVLLAELKPGETVLDLGSGGGIDVLLSAKRVGPAGKAYGLDMTDEMLELARANAREAGATNVEFLKGEIEAIPLPDASVDVIISNCVINLSADKDAVLGEAFRVLKPGGRFAVADIVVQGGQMSAELRQILALWAGCISGALTEEEYRQKLARAGFYGVDLEVLSEYGLEDLPAEARCCMPADLKLDPGTKIVSAFVRATKA